MSDDDLGALLGSVHGLQFFCSALAGTLPPGQAAAISANLALIASKLRKELETAAEGREQLFHAALALDTLQSALKPLAEPGSPPKGSAAH